MVIGMKTRWLLVATLVLALGLLAGCSSSSEDNPFEGSWASPTGKLITFGESTWNDSDGDSGGYSYSGDHPVYTLRFTPSGAVRRARFLDLWTLEICSLNADGTPNICDVLTVYDPTLH